VKTIENYYKKLRDGKASPRYSFKNRGSKNFVKPRMEYREDKEKIQKLRKLLENN